MKDISTLIAKLFGKETDQIHHPEHLEIEVSEFPGLKVEVISLAKNYTYWFADLTLPKPIEAFRRICGWYLNEGIGGCVMYNLRTGVPWAPDEEGGATIAVRKDSVCIYSRPEYFVEAIDISKKLISNEKII